MNNLDQNLYNTDFWNDVEIISKSEKIIDQFLIQIESFSYDSYSFRENLSMLGFIGEVYPILADKNKWDEISYQILKNIKYHLEEKGLHRISLYDGLANIALFCNILVRNSGHFQKFLSSLHTTLFNLTLVNTKYMMENKDQFTNSFIDVIVGMAGIGHYLLSLKSPDPQCLECIQKICKFFVSFCHTKQVNAVEVPGWYVNGNNQATSEYRSDYPLGSINYSISHGIVGPLLFLSEASKYRIEVSGQKEAIKYILNELKRVEQNISTEGYLWPGLLSFQDYSAGQYSQYNGRMSWCYGTLSTLYALLQASEALEDKAIKDWALNHCLTISSWEMEKYNLFSPIICHGYAGLAVTFYRLNQLYPRKKFYTGCQKLITELLKSYDPSYKYGFRDVIFKNEDGHNIKEVRDKIDFLEGSCGCMMTLLLLLKDNIDFPVMLMF